jgi:hypothetical protein
MIFVLIDFYDRSVAYEKLEHDTPVEPYHFTSKI